MINKFLVDCYRFWVDPVRVDPLSLSRLWSDKQPLKRRNKMKSLPKQPFRVVLIRFNKSQGVFNKPHYKKYNFGQARRQSCDVTK